MLNSVPLVIAQHSTQDDTSLLNHPLNAVKSG